MNALELLIRNQKHCLAFISGDWITDKISSFCLDNHSAVFRWVLLMSGICVLIFQWRCEATLLSGSTNLTMWNACMMWKRAHRGVFFFFAPETRHVHKLHLACIAHAINSLKVDSLSITFPGSFHKAIYQFGSHLSSTCEIMIPRLISKF